MMENQTPYDDLGETAADLDARGISCTNGLNQPFIDEFSEEELKKREKLWKNKLRSSKYCGDGDSSDDSDGWDEMETETEENCCLFCELKFNKISTALQHCLSDHNFDLNSLKQKHKMDVYSYIKLINYIRSKNPSIKEIMECISPLWNTDEFLKPVVQDNWLMFDFEDWEETTKVSANKIDDADELLRNQTIKIEEQQEMIARLLSDMQKMRVVTKSLMDSNETVKVPEPAGVGDSSGYFNTYAHYGIHHQMLQDRVRTETYMKAILNNSESLQNKLVLDLGCGTGILSMFAAKAGAKQVFAVDNSSVIYQAMDIIRENGFANKINLIHGQIETTRLPEYHVDVIVSEWMGYFLLFEGMLDSFVYARDRYLNPDSGVLLPNRCTLELVGCADPERHSTLIGFWDDVYGFKMSCMVPEVIAEASVEIVPVESVITTNARILDLNLYTCSKDSCNFETEFQLTALDDGGITSIVGYFDTFFTSLPNNVEFSTGPKATPTHWKQTVFYLKEPINVIKGDVILGTIICKRAKNDLRSLTVTLKIGDMTQNYSVE